MVQFFFWFSEHVIRITRLRRVFFCLGNCSDTFDQAPEVFLGAYSDKVDLWSVGVILFRFLFGVYPYPANALQASLEQINVQCMASINHVREQNASTIAYLEREIRSLKISSTQK
eukprot:TRINITY_DN3749_c0_g1_i1.p2 TRINITY_DN3749_c0_g1~~TRINITY_DN3749_c0_g1_i1.p2  ORF type:complete len:115 (-),score=20.69 TRINITY_DN3749_c0_g1_i1:526-870(-)